jgi:hypothetical protein
MLKKENLLAPQKNSFKKPVFRLIKIEKSGNALVSFSDEVIFVENHKMMWEVKGPIEFKKGEEKMLYFACCWICSKLLFNI